MITRFALRLIEGLRFVRDFLLDDRGRVATQREQTTLRVIWEDKCLDVQKVF